jgi:hypothetical protein
MTVLRKKNRPVQINIEDYKIKVLCRLEVRRVSCLYRLALLLLVSHCDQTADAALQICPQQYNDSLSFSDFYLSTNLIFIEQNHEDSIIQIYGSG